MDSETILIQYFPLIETIAKYPDIYYKCEHNPDMIHTELNIFILSVNGLSIWDFQNALKEEIKKGVAKVEEEIKDMESHEVKDLIRKLKENIREIQRLILKSKTTFEEIPYFSKANFDDRDGNHVYVSRMNELSHTSYITSYSYKLDGSSVTKVNHLYLHINASPFTKYFVTILDELMDKVDELNIAIHYDPNNSDEENGLILINKHSSKELTYLFNLLYRIRFFQLKEGENEKLYRLIAGIYKSSRRLKADKARNIKNNWNSSQEHEIDKSFIEKFLKNVLKEMTDRAQEDSINGYDPKRMSKLNVPKK